MLPNPVFNFSAVFPVFNIFFIDAYVSSEDLHATLFKL